ncbi:hypothetical protein GQ44DRAFT_564123, partial [Phaeosphaeriaceae sp. PMI808]
IAIAATYFHLSISAASVQVPHVAITITNEFNGKTAAASILADGSFKRVPDLFANSDLDENGRFFGTSAQLTRFVDNSKCLIHRGAGMLRLNSSTPLVDLDGNPNVALLKPLLLNSFQFRC